jgi:hypothetical protein
MTHTHADTNIYVYVCRAFFLGGRRGTRTPKTFCESNGRK